MVDVVHILRTEGIAVVVDFTLFVVGNHDMLLVCVLDVAEQQYHVLKGLGGVFKHRVDVG